MIDTGHDRLALAVAVATRRLHQRMITTGVVLHAATALAATTTAAGLLLATTMRREIDTDGHHQGARQRTTATVHHVLGILLRILTMLVGHLHRLVVTKASRMLMAMQSEASMPVPLRAVVLAALDQDTEKAMIAAGRFAATRPMEAGWRCLWLLAKFDFFFPNPFSFFLCWTGPFLWFMNSTISRQYLL